MAGVIEYMTGWMKYGGFPYKNGHIFRLAVAVIVAALCTIPVTGQPDLPDKPDLIRVTVVHSNNGVLIQWEASTDTTVDLYHIYRMENGTGTKLFSFKPQTLEYTHMTSGLENLAYTVTAEDTTGGTTRESLLEDNEHRAVAIELEFNPCEPANIINWTGYVGWEGKISGYRVYGGIAGSELQPLIFVHANTRSFEHEGIQIGQVYRYYVETVHTSGMTSLSPIDSINSIYPDAPDFLTMDYVSVLDRSDVELQFTADVEGPVNNFRVMRTLKGDSVFSEVTTIWNTNQSTHVIQDHFSIVNSSYEYKVESLFQPESCLNPVVISQSNPGTCMLLVGKLEQQIASLSWTSYNDYPNGLAGYIIQRKSSGGEFVDLQTVGPGNTSWNETIESVINGYQPGELQYRVLAVEEQDGTGDFHISESNIVSLAVETNLLVPNAFTPGSGDINSEFKPRIDFAPKNYTMIIYDRVGRKLFETSNPGEGWNGSFRGGDLVMEGVYIYFIQYTDYTGLFRTLSGNVTVLYPEM